MNLDDLFDLGNEIQKCSACRLRGYACVKWDYNHDEPRVMVVGEAPGKDEVRDLTPFVGRSGSMVRELLRKLDLPFFITNVVKCHPPRNKTPDGTMVETCKRFLESEIRIVRPVIIIALGNTAQNAVLGESGLHLCGKMCNNDGKLIYCLPHPAYILRNPNKKKELWDDNVEKLLEIMQEEMFSRDQ